MASSLYHDCFYRTIDHVRIWKFDSEDHVVIAEATAGHLSLDEIDRRNRLVSQQLRDQFTVFRSSMRIVLAQDLGLDDPGKVAFLYGPNGKPSVLGNIYFNLSHSKNIALLAVSTKNEVGIDIEKIDHSVDIINIAGNFSTPSENSRIKALNESKHDAFFRLWCQKEAFLKAEGIGIIGGINRYEITRTEGSVAQVVNLNIPQRILPWTIQSFDPEPGYAAALCYKSFLLKSP